MTAPVLFVPPSAASTPSMAVPQPAALSAAAEVAAFVGRVEAASESWLASLRSPHTASAYRRSIAVWRAWCVERGVDWLRPSAAEARSWVGWLEAGSKPATVRLRVAGVRSWFAELTVCALRPNDDPFSRARLPTLPSVDPLVVVGLSTSDVLALLAAAREVDTPAETCVGLLAVCGLRASECGRMSSSSVLDGGGLGPLLRFDGKGGKSAVMPLPPLVRDAVRRVGWPGADLPAGAGPDAARKRVQGWCERVAVRAGVSPFSTHMLRHWFVTESLEAGVDLRRVQDGARHADPRTTRGYDDARNSLSGHVSWVLAERLIAADGAGGVHPAPLGDGGNDARNVGSRNVPTSPALTCI